MFIAKSENQTVISKLILSEATFGIFGVVLLVVMLFFAFAGTASEPGQQKAKIPQNKPVNSPLVARNMR